MAKGKKAIVQVPKSLTDADADPFADQSPVKAQEGSGPLVCSYCHTLLDRTKADEGRCWLCGRRDFINPTEVELQRQKKQAEKRELCCPNPNCERPPELVRNSEKYCGGCGATLEKASVELWIRKCVEPVARKDPSRLMASRPKFIDAAWLLQITKEEAEANFDEYRASQVFKQGEAGASRGSSGDESTRASIPAVSADAGAKEEFSARAEDLRRDKAVWRGLSSSLYKERYQRQIAIRIKIGIVIACFLGIAVFVLFAGRSAPIEQRNDVGLPPSPPSPAATTTPLPAPTPPPMVEISGGEFRMGRDAAEGGDKYESPSHPVTVRPFLMDVYEVTREEYQRCVEAGKCAKPSVWNGDSYSSGTGRLPVTGVTWKDANDYALWVGKSLPTEEQWEFAARGKDNRLYPWGREWKQGQANLGSNHLTEVGSYHEASPFGLSDLIGNAQEWTKSEWKKYPDKAMYLSKGAAPESLRVIRGGSYKDAATKVTATYRNALRMSTEDSYEQTGFRCVRETDQQ
jgi:formylglycine-generating enzyme required for sulfatase activity